MRTQLEQLLRRTLTRATPPSPATRDVAEERQVDRLTEPRWFRLHFERAPDGGAILVLNPPVIKPLLTQPAGS